MSKLTAEQIATRQAEWERWHVYCNFDDYRDLGKKDLCGQAIDDIKCTAENCPVLNLKKDGE